MLFASVANVFAAISTASVKPSLSLSTIAVKTIYLKGRHVLGEFHSHSAGA